jgi:hypothetical protein
MTVQLASRIASFWIVLRLGEKLKRTPRLPDGLTVGAGDKSSFVL